MRRLTLLVALLLAIGAPSTTAPSTTAAAAFPDRIDLPSNFAPEGIAIGRGNTFYTGSLSGQGIWQGDLRTGLGAFLVEGGGPFLGIKVDAANRLWVAGGPAGNGHVFDAATGDSLGMFSLAPAGAATFVNDVALAAGAAWFTDSFRGVIYRVDIATGAVSELDLTALAPAEANVFRLNGIDATPNGKFLVAVNSNEAELYRIDTSSLAVTTIDMGGVGVAGDGILLAGRMLYAVRNQDHVARIALSADLSSGTIVDELTGDFDVPTTVARHGSSLYVVNARFGTTDPSPVAYWVTRLSP
jgi:sugar lactone lactonase YvrE